MIYESKQLKTAVFYHADCLDGYGAAWAAWKCLGDTAHYQAVRHHNPVPDFAQVHILPHHEHPPCVIVNTHTAPS